MEIQKERQHLVDRVLFKKDLEAKWLERNAVSNEMLAHGFDPMQTKGVQHGTCALHYTQNSHGQEEPHIEPDDNHDNPER